MSVGRLSLKSLIWVIALKQRGGSRWHNPV